MRTKLLDSIVKTRIDPKFISFKRFQNIIYKEKYQVVEIVHRHVWRQNHVPLSVNLTPTNFKYRYKEQLDIKKIIVILGEWHHMAYYYHFLTHNNYNVRLVK